MAVDDEENRDEVLRAGSKPYHRVQVVQLPIGQHPDDEGIPCPEGYRFDGDISMGWTPMGVGESNVLGAGLHAPLREATIVWQRSLVRED